MPPSRRHFLGGSALAGLALAGRPDTGHASDVAIVPASALPVGVSDWQRPLDLTPAKWVWYPSGRCLQNTCILFRKTFDLTDSVVKCSGWLLAESRYKLFVNGHYVQFGPAPSDPRFSECDPLDAIKPWLKPGRNVIAVQALYFGQGDGTWPLGKPGLICNLAIETADRVTTTVLSDRSWQTHLARSWKPGQYKRWYLRALQEERDERLFPSDWDTAGFETVRDWRPAAELEGAADKPALCNSYPEYQWEIFGDAKTCSLRRRSVAMPTESFVAVTDMPESAWIDWKVPAEDYFDMLVPDAFDVVREPSCDYGDGSGTIRSRGALAAILTFRFAEQAVGWPVFEIDAPAGTVVELLVHEAHQVGGPPIMNSHFHSWTRFICAEGLNRFETFDFESFRWLQLHVRNYNRPVVVRQVGIRRREMPWPNRSQIVVDDPNVQTVIRAAVNTLSNCAQETIVDGMGRERQQYSGDGSHQLHALYSSFGETRLPGRFVNTFGQGLALAGFFFDSWPAYDRLARTMERQLDLTQWGPILDHSVGFCFDCWYYHLYTGRLEALRETFPRLLIFFNYLQSIRSKDGLVPVQDLGLPTVWIDHEAYRAQRDKQCAFNLYIAAMCEHALAPLAEAFGQLPQAVKIRQFGATVRAAVVKTFWSASDRCFINNLPWQGTDREKRFCDRALATAVLYDQCPGHDITAAHEKLKAMPSDTGRSYPANAIWRYWALAKLGEADIILDELATRWRAMESVGENNTLQEFWHAEKDGTAQWSHCAVAPLIIMHMGMAGIVPTTPGYRTCDIKPQPGRLTTMTVVTNTVAGPVVVETKGPKGKRLLTLDVPAYVTARLLLPAGENIDLPPLNADSGESGYLIKGPARLSFDLRML